MWPPAAEDKQPAEWQGHLWDVLEALPLGKHLLGAIPPSSSSVGMGGTLDCRDQCSKGRGQPLIWRVSSYVGGGLIFRSFDGLGFPAADARPGEGEMTSSTCRCQRLGVLGPSTHLPGSRHPLNAVNVDNICRGPLPKVALQGGTNQLASVCPGSQAAEEPGMPAWLSSHPLKARRQRMAGPALQALWSPHRAVASASYSESGLSFAGQCCALGIVVRRPQQVLRTAHLGNGLPQITWF